MKSAVLGLAVVALLAACGGSTAHPGPQPCPEGPVPAPPQLVYPSPGATGIPDGNFALFFADVYGTITLFGQPVLMPVAGGPSVTAGPYALEPTASPSPPQYLSEVPSLLPATAYSVNVTSPASGGPCATTDTLGTFTTK